MHAFTVTKDGELVLTSDATRLGLKSAYPIVAPTWGEAWTIYCRRSGKAYDPGPPSDCVVCGAVVYEREAFECWVCQGDQSVYEAAKNAKRYGQDEHEEVGLVNAHPENATTDSPLFAALEE